jgi:predicted alternative tryptophan synthase beta-subunit
LSVAPTSFSKVAGTKALTAETGAGQWGSALATAFNFFDLNLKIYMVIVSYHQEPYRRIIMDLQRRGGALRQPHRPHPCRRGGADDGEG